MIRSSVANVLKGGFRAIRPFNEGVLCLIFGGAFYQKLAFCNKYILIYKI